MEVSTGTLITPPSVECTSLLALLLLALSAVAMLSGSPNLQLGMLPWTGKPLINVLFYGSLAGLVLNFAASRRFVFDRGGPG